GCRLALEPRQLVDEPGGTGGEHSLGRSRGPRQQPGLEAQQVGHEVVVLGEPQVEGRCRQAPVADGAQKRVPGRLHPRGLVTTEKSTAAASGRSGAESAVKRPEPGGTAHRGAAAAPRSTGGAALDG